MVIRPLLTGFLIVGGLFAQPAPTFEAATIKPSPDATGDSSGIVTTSGRIHAANVTLKRCVRGAWDVQDAQVLGGPKWVDQDRYYIDAVAGGPAGGHELMLMLQSLLAERFKLALHRETRDFSGYALVAAKGGFKAKPSDPHAGSKGNARRGGIAATGYTLHQLANKLGDALLQPVVDSTGMEGAFDFSLEWDPKDNNASLFSAIQEQLGLRLEARKIPTEVLVIDNAEKPAGN